MDMGTFKEQLRRQAEAAGAAYFGVAELEPAQKFISQYGGEFMARFPRAVSIGVPISNAATDQLIQHDDVFLARNYSHHIYTAIGGLLDQIALSIALKLQEAGFQAFPVMSGGGWDARGLYALFSHKLAAHLAGLGWIGKSCMLITPDRGVRVRWVSVLTDAPLPARGELVPQRCGKCQACVDICPVHAYTGAPFSPHEPREARFDAHRCYGYLMEREQKDYARICGLCVYVCPVGRGKRRGAA